MMYIRLSFDDFSAGNLDKLRASARRQLALQNITHPVDCGLEVKITGVFNDPPATAELISVMSHALTGIAWERPACVKSWDGSRVSTGLNNRVDVRIGLML